MKSMDFILTTAEPWVVCARSEFDLVFAQVERLCQDRPDMRVVVLEGRAMMTFSAFYSELERRLRLPSYFGRNADALDECLNDLSWLAFGALVLLIKDSNQVLIAEPAKALGTFLDTLWTAGAEWARPHEDRLPVPFHTVLLQPNQDLVGRSGFPYHLECVDVSADDPAQRQ